MFTRIFLVCWIMGKWVFVNFSALSYMSLFTGFFVFLSMSAINSYMLYRLIDADIVKENLTKDYQIVEKNLDSNISNYKE